MPSAEMTSRYSSNSVLLRDRIPALAGKRGALAK
jgi:hypothetical protein